MQTYSDMATTRSSELARNLPLATAGTIGLCCSVYVSQIVLDVNVRLFTMCPRLVLHLHEYYRVVTSCFFHGSLMHIGMNMLSTAAISTMIERRFGTLSYVMTCLWAIFTTGTLNCIFAVAVQVLLGKDDLVYQHSLGFSGIMFHLLVLESNLTPHASRSVFGFMHVPSWAYPAVMLVVMQVMIPGNISFTGHLCGMLSGTLHLYGLLDVVMVNAAFLQEIEHWSVLRSLTSKDNYVPTPSSNNSGESQLPRRGLKNLLRSIHPAFQTVIRIAYNVLETIYVAIFGRGTRLNSNNQLGRIRNPFGAAQRPQHDNNHNQAVIDEDEDEEWGGLPLIEQQDRQQQSEIL